MEETKKCSNCSRAPQALSEFRVGEKEFKSCQKCRDKGKRKDEARRQNPEIREQRNAQQREMRYYQAYRERKKSEDPGYAEHVAELQRQRRALKKETQSTE